MRKFEDEFNYFGVRIFHAVQVRAQAEEVALRRGGGMGSSGGGRRGSSRGKWEGSWERGDFVEMFFVLVPHA